MSVLFPWCDECENLIPKDNKYCCKAFPEGIPSEILFDKHIKSRSECNDGYRFTKN